MLHLNTCSVPTAISDRFISECFVSNFVLFLNKRDGLSKWALTRFYITCKRHLFLYNNDRGVNFCGKNFCGTFFSRDLFFVDREKNPQKSQKSQKLEPAKIKCHAVICNIDGYVFSGLEDDTLSGLLLGCLLLYTLVRSKIYIIPSLYIVLSILLFFLPPRPF